MPLKVFKRGRIWHYRGTVAGRELRGTTKATDKTIAEQVAAKVEADWWKCRLDGPESVLTFAQAAILYIEAGRSRRFLNIVADHWRDSPVKLITPGAIRLAAVEIYPKAGPATRNRQVIVPTQAVINHAHDLELCPPIRVKRFPVPKRDMKYATWEWIEAFMEHAGTPHLGALACFMFCTGARISEALDIKWCDVDLQRSEAVVNSGKIGWERRVHLPPPLMVAIANIEGERQGRVFQITSRSNAKTQWAGTIRRAGIQPMSYHACRHGFATAMLRAGIDPVTVAKRGGWKSPAHVFATYGHAIEDITITDVITRTNSAHK